MTKVLLIMSCLIWMYACNQSPSENKQNSISKSQSDLGPLEGTWIYHDSASFELVEIRDTNDIDYYSFLNRAMAIGEKDISLKSFFYKSEAHLGFIDSTHIWIRTDKYQFDYILGKDSLIEYDKMGPQKSLIRFEAK